MFDIDHFNSINDQHGHGIGDGVLRANDVLVRWGGEEFMIVVPHTGEEAADLAEKLCAAVEAHRFPQVPRVAASFGARAYTPGDTLETLYARTDEALYRAKHQGRNRVCSMFVEAAPT